MERIVNAGQARTEESGFRALRTRHQEAAQRALVTGVTPEVFAGDPVFEELVEQKKEGER